MAEEDRSQEVRLKKIKEINNYFFKEIAQNKLLSYKNKKVCTSLIYTEHYLRTLVLQLLYLFKFQLLLL